MYFIEKTKQNKNCVKLNTAWSLFCNNGQLTVREASQHASLCFDMYDFSLALKCQIIIFLLNTVNRLTVVHLSEKFTCWFHPNVWVFSLKSSWSLTSLSFNTQALSSLSIQLRFSLLGAALRQEALTFKKLFEVVGNCRHFLLESLSQNSTPCFLSNNKARHLLFAHTHHELIQQCYDPEGPFSKSCFWICPGPLVMYWPPPFLLRAAIFN